MQRQTQTGVEASKLRQMRQGVAALKQERALALIPTPTPTPTPTLPLPHPYPSPYPYTLEQELEAMREHAMTEQAC